MLDLQALKNHPLAPLFRARFDNNDVAFALDLPTFPEWRKNWERGQTAFHLPRNDANPIRPKYCYAHVIEYALSLAFSKITTKAVASHITWRVLSFNRDTADDRFNKYDAATKGIIVSNNSFQDMGKSLDLEIYERSKYWPLVDFPAVGFDPLYLDRSPERLANPLIWVLAPDITEASDFSLSSHAIWLTECLPVDGVLQKLSARRWHGSTDYDGPGPRYHSAHIVNVTRLLWETEARLRTRLEGKGIRGEDE
ncbi:hypothetical protein [Ancylobacter terrae]|uniref:hypothetical protein n=1 Tax=Ancylobacter sp. sgz301288 TaxID=3342077 RepID=UPI00385C2C89